MNEYQEILSGEIYTIDRSDPYENVVYIPKNNPNYPEFPDGKHMNRIENMEYTVKKHKLTHWFGRRDLLRVSLYGKCNGKEREIYSYWIDGKLDGSIDWPSKEIEKLVSPTIKKEVEAIIQRILKAGEKYPLMLSLLV